MSEILIIDDDVDICNVLSAIIKREGYSTRISHNPDDALAAVSERCPDLIILDINFKGFKMDGIDILKIVKRDYPDIPLVIITAKGKIEIAVRAIKLGAYDFIPKPFNADEIVVVIERGMETSRLRQELQTLKIQSDDLSLMIGSSPVYRTLVGNLDRVANANSRVLLSGPPGSGKELAAHYIHSNSSRANGKFVSVNFSSIDSEGIEETLFGREDRDGIAKGLLEEADGGVLFFEEIAEMPISIQSKIVHFLVKESIRRIGGEKSITCDTRVVSSTSRDMNAEIVSGRFRNDLFHRLNVVPISVPGLDKRREDIPAIADHFINRISQSQGLPLRKLSEEANTHLQSMDWPGNLRQLRNVIERALILGNQEGDIEAREIFDDGVSNGEESKIALPREFLSLPLREAREKFESEYLIAQIKRYGGNISRTSEFVGMERSALHRKMRHLGMAPSNT
ncbi:MAG: sigma-54 dependent transcriptional regulator [Roseovarius sp.]|nr:sigma-54 dependent transcriptional regulator [Roseovarius sp.]MCY4316058.1 sigma-54 dependent transcriptional regulator [Roseovarius sp.]